MRILEGTVIGRLSIAGLMLASGSVFGVEGAPATSSVMLSDGSEVLMADPLARESAGVLLAQGEGERSVLMRSDVIVKAPERVVRNAVASLGDGVRVVRPIGSDRFWVVSTPNVGEAVRIADLLNGLQGVEWAQVDRSRGVDRAAMESVRRLQSDRMERIRIAATAPGVAAVVRSNRDAAGPRGVAVDPQVPNQWHLTNTMNPGRDLNVGTIYADGVTGSGVTVSISSTGELQFDTTHPDLDEDAAANQGFNPAVSDTPNPFLSPDSIDTFLAGLIGAQINGQFGQGVAPGVRLSGLIRGTPLLEADAFQKRGGTVGVRLHPMRFQTGPEETYSYTTPDDSFQAGFSEFVSDALTTSFSFGRHRLGTVQVFSAGADGLFPLPAAYGGNGWTDFLAGTQVGVTVTNNYLVGPAYMGGMLHYYPPAGDRQSFVFNTVDESGIGDVFASLGSSVFASFYGTTVQTSVGGFDPPRAAVSTLPSSGFGALSESGLTLGSSNATGAAIGAGVIALMLEVNPSLTLRDIQHILQASSDPTGLDFNPTEEYFRPTRMGAYLAGIATPSFWETNAAFVRHSDVYGFGLVDADMAVSLARDWERVGRLFVLDTGLITSDDANGTFGGLPIPDAEIVETSDLSSMAVNNNNTSFLTFCVRDNIVIEGVEIMVTAEGVGNNDLAIWVDSPQGTHANLHYPTSLNPMGTADPDLVDNEADAGFAGSVVGQTTYAFYRHKFVSYKFWNEMAGGRWTIGFRDYGPDTEPPEGEEPDGMGDPGADNVLTLPPLFVPGDPTRTEKTVTEYRVRIYGTSVDAPPFLGCAPAETSCPGDVNGDGVVNFLDLAWFLDWYNTNNPLADINGDGAVTYPDLQAFLGLWVPGFCSPSGFPFNRPNPADSDPARPVVRPI